jgi:hypothetical protein
LGLYYTPGKEFTISFALVKGPAASPRDRESFFSMKIAKLEQRSAFKELDIFE